MTWHHTHELAQHVSSWRPLGVIKPSKAQYYHKEEITKGAENHGQPPDFASHGLMRFRIWCLSGDSVIPENQTDTFANKKHPQAASPFIRNESKCLFSPQLRCSKFNIFVTLAGVIRNHHLLPLPSIFSYCGTKL